MAAVLNQAHAASLPQQPQQQPTVMQQQPQRLPPQATPELLAEIARGIKVNANKFYIRTPGADPGTKRN